MNLKTGNYSPFVLLPIEDESLVYFLEASFDGLDDILSNLTIVNNDAVELNMLNHYFESNEQKIIMLMLNSSRFCMGLDAFKYIGFSDSEFMNIYNDVFLGFDENDMLIAISFLIYKLSKDIFDCQ